MTISETTLKKIVEVGIAALVLSVFFSIYFVMRNVELYRKVVRQNEILQRVAAEQQVLQAMGAEFVQLSQHDPAFREHLEKHGVKLSAAIAPQP
jgi:hypothetical protein